MTDQPGSYRRGYDQAGSSAYQVRKEPKHQAELRLVDRAFRAIPPPLTVLDAPCGGGRVALHLAQCGYTVTAADLSEHMVSITRENVSASGAPITVDQQDLEQLSYEDASFDVVFCFRLFHHFPTRDLRQRVVGELCRVARRYVVLSYFHPLSWTSAQRRLRSMFGGKQSTRHATWLREVNGYFDRHGYRLVQDHAQLPLVRTLHLARFERRDLSGTP